MPTSSVLHYATECFEGLKLYRGHDSRLRLFRPLRNCHRMSRSASRVALPAFSPPELEKLILALCAHDGPKWLPPSRKGKFLYVRPTLISDDPSLGVQAPKRALLFVILTMFPDLSDPKALGGGSGDEDGVQGLRLLASKEDTIRAWPGGFGFAKLGANYGPSLLAQGEARKRGFHQILWLFGSEGYVTEAGASNFFVVWRTKEGGTELVTAGLEDKVILEGVTRGSLLELARERLEEVKVVERKYTMAEIVEAEREGRLVEAFAAGTAFFVAPVGLIEWKGERIRVPTGEGASGKYAALLRGWLSDIMYGGEEHEWGVVVDEKKEE
ncbi:aminotransferase [Elsinoe ampelina]|uniref:Branched-chain-amino-acid aminotransferase n=1 Tax=Elsinoe ampelina TaxID=302913 RepID=A0A6A6G0X0_9PEZI|nr:aminotransferase [Elsinoe ampelina]